MDNLGKEGSKWTRRTWNDASRQKYGVKQSFCKTVWGYFIKLCTNAI